MGYYSYFLLYVFVGFVLCAALFAWAVVNGQFGDQKRARYLPLTGSAPAPRDASTAKWPRSMVWSVLAILVGLAVQIAAVLVMSATT